MAGSEEKFERHSMAKTLGKRYVLCTLDNSYYNIIFLMMTA